MIRSLSVIVLGAVLVWPAGAYAQRGGARGGGGGGARGGGGGTRGTVARAPAAVRAPAVNSRSTTINLAPIGGALGTAGGPGPWIGAPVGPAVNTPGLAATLAINRSASVGLGNVGLGANIGYGYGYGDFGFANVGFLPQYGVYNPGYYGVPTLFPSFNTGYYPPGVWPSPVVTQPIYPTPYIPEIPEAVDPGISPQDMILAAELARISEQLQALRNQQAAPVAVPAPQQQPQPPSTQGPSQEKPSAATVLIMRDGRRIETQSYAIADQMLWVFDQGTTLRFSMADVDVDATRAENSRRGIRFLVG